MKRIKTYSIWVVTLCLVIINCKCIYAVENQLVEEKYNDAIESIDEEIASSNVEIQKFSNQIRQLKWDNFDYLQDKISQIKQEADFMIGLLESSDLFDDAGQITANGRGVLGLHGQNYDVLMEKADKYAEEVKNINKELAKDPYNQDLIKYS